MNNEQVTHLFIGEEPGVVLEVRHLGATVHRLLVTDADGRRRNLVLGHQDDEAYLAGTDFRGAIVGRFANRIAGGRFELDGRPVQLDTNERGNSLHGGPDGFHRREWEVVAHEHDLLRLRLVSPDGDQGFPGELTATVTYTTTVDSVAVEIEATSDAPTLASLTSHVYWNLDGAATIDGHALRVDADRYLPVDAAGIPTGELAGVAGTPYDLRQGPLLEGRVIDHTYVLDGGAALSAGGWTVEMSTNRPGVQVYTGEFLDGAPRGGVALEPQLFPDSPHHPDFPSAVLRPGEVSRTEIEWRLVREPGR